MESTIDVPSNELLNATYRDIEQFRTLFKFHEAAIEDEKDDLTEKFKID